MNIIYSIVFFLKNKSKLYLMKGYNSKFNSILCVLNTKADVEDLDDIDVIFI
jgi:hypothetical protein